jgi:hypothetical protein
MAAFSLFVQVTHNTWGAGLEASLGRAAAPPFILETEREP